MTTTLVERMLGAAGATLDLATVVEYPQDVVTTLVAAGISGPTGICIDGNETYAYVAANDGNVYKITLRDGTVATLCALSGKPYGIAINPAGTELAVALYNAHVIKRVQVSDGSVLTTLGAGAGATGVDAHDDNADGTLAYFSNPTGVSFASASLLLVCDYGMDRIRSVEWADDFTVTRLCGGGNTGASGDTDGAKDACRINDPNGIVANAAGTYAWFCDAGNSKVKKVTVATGAVVTVAGGGSDPTADKFGTAARFSGPMGIALNQDENAAIVVEYSGNRIRVVNLLSTHCPILAGDGSAAETDGTGTAAAFNHPAYPAVHGRSGRVYVTDYVGNTIRKLGQ